MAVRAPHHRYFFGDPGRAADDAKAAGERAARILGVAKPVVIGAVPVAHPFPDVADDIAQAIRIRRVRAGGPCAALAF